MQTRHSQPRHTCRFVPPVRGGARKLAVALALLAAVIAMLTLAGYRFGDEDTAVAPEVGREAPVQ